ncbi:DNA repair exonuclease [Pigmentiphaga aceris]|uniref:DNA repair exonuclease n=1 Tax=Pigmentiphaga aceris TaxID=1940612 RepID=A0A5C0B7G0_9BURK|nr:DNA repair exonuclease [Pigmentiphaga aceris]QEI09001.1 DNA repair exonuclease [Pigmentiphaga aceris]
MLRFIHTADWQIGRHYGQFDVEDGAVLADARIDTVGRIAQLAASRQVDAVLVAGDVFDTQAVSDRTIRRLFAALAPFAGPWIMIAGNHDAALADSVWTRAAQLGCVPANVHRPNGLLVLPDLRAAVLAAPLTQRHTYDDVTDAFDRLESPDDHLRIGIAHGSVTGRLPDTIDSTNSIAADRASRARLDYLALGDWHGCLQIDANTWYAGTPEQDRFRGNEPGFVLEVAIDAVGAVPAVTRHQIGRYVWSSWSVHISVPSDVDELAQRLAQLGPQDVLQIEVGGHVNLATRDRLDACLADASARVRSLRSDVTAMVLEPDEHDLVTLGAQGYVSDVLQQLRVLQEDPAKADLAREALGLLVRYQRELTVDAPAKEAGK